MGIGVFNEVWHRVWPLVPEAYQRFVDYYADQVVAPNQGLLDVLGGFRYLEGDTNSDVTLYRYESIPAIANVSASFGQDPAYIEATEALLRDIRIEETRTLALPLPCSTEERLEQTLADEPAQRRRYVVRRRILPGAERMRATELIGRCANEVEGIDSPRVLEDDPGDLSLREQGLELGTHGDLLEGPRASIRTGVRSLPSRSARAAWGACHRDRRREAG